MAFYTFSNKRLTFKQATERHGSVSKIVDMTKNINNKKDKIEMLDNMQEVWDTLVGIIEDEKKGMIADGIDWTIPKEYIPIMHLGDCIAASFAFKCIVHQFINDGINNDDDVAVREALRKAWLAFEQRRLEANYVEEGFGCDQSASWHTLRDIADHNGSDELNQEMEEIAKLAGRMFKSFKYTKTKMESDDPQSIKQTTIGGDVERLVPSEMVKLGTDSTKDITSMKVLKKEAQQFKMKGLRTKSRGPLVLTIDESGSMHDRYSNYRGRNCWAKACAVALTRIAWSEDRPVRVVHFGNSTVTQKVPKDDLSAMFEMARSFLSGGTDFGIALREAHNQVGDLDKEGYKGADIVFITDGEEPDHDKHNKMIDKLDDEGIKLWTIAVADRMTDEAPMKKRAEKYIYVKPADLQEGLEDGVDNGLLDGLQDAAMAKLEPEDSEAN